MTIKVKVTKIDKDFGYDEIKRYTSRTRRTTLQVGVLQGEHDKAEMPVAELAAIHEYGLGNNPERSFLRATLQEQQSVYDALFNRSTKDSIAKRYTAIGKQAVADIREKIDRHIPPPLAESTIAQKGHDHPLIDTEQLYNSLTFTVKGSRVPLPKAMR